MDDIILKEQQMAIHHIENERQRDRGGGIIYTRLLFRIYAIRNWLKEFENVSKVILQTLIILALVCSLTPKTHLLDTLLAKNHSYKKTIIRLAQLVTE